MANRRPRDPKKPHPWWNAVLGRRVYRGAPSARSAHPVPKRHRAKIMRRIKRHYNLTRRDMGAIGAGHQVAPWTGGE